MAQDGLQGGASKRPISDPNSLRRGASLFWDGLGMALMSGHHGDFVALDLALQNDRGAAIDDPLAKLPDHPATPTG